jgi:Protein of unknown function (DUF3105)
MRTRTALAGVVVLAAVAVGCSEKQEGQPVDPGNAKPNAPGSALPTAVAPEQIEGVRTKEYPARAHVSGSERVNYRESPPFGGTHDAVWAACNGVVYPQAIRTENLVHSLEHGAVWIAYRPGLEQAAVDALANRVINQPYTVMSPYPGLDRPISLQAWGFQLKLDEATDPRIDQFIAVLRRNQDTTPEPDATCDPIPDAFDPQRPPPFDPNPPGADAVPDDQPRPPTP